MTNSDRNNQDRPRRPEYAHRQSYTTIREFLDMAVAFEEDSEAFYREMQSKAGEEETRQLLDLLARQEHHHAEILREYEAPAGGGQGFLQFPPSLTQAMPRPKSENPGFDEMLELAIERERRSAEMYRRAASFVRGEFEELLEGLVVFEREHEEKLRSLQQYY